MYDEANIPREYNDRRDKYHKKLYRQLFPFSHKSDYEQKLAKNIFDSMIAFPLPIGNNYEDEYALMEQMIVLDTMMQCGGRPIIDIIGYCAKIGFEALVYLLLNSREKSHYRKIIRTTPYVSSEYCDYLDILPVDRPFATGHNSRYWIFTKVDILVGVVFGHFNSDFNCDTMLLKKQPRSKDNVCFNCTGLSVLQSIVNFIRYVNDVVLYPAAAPCCVNSEFTQDSTMREWQVSPYLKRDIAITEWENEALRSLKQTFPQSDWPTWRIEQEWQRIRCNMINEQIEYRQVCTKTELVKASLPKPKEIAYLSWRYAINKLGTVKKTYKEAHDWLKENGPAGYEVPAFHTWKRYVSEGKKYYNTPTNTPRAGRADNSPSVRSLNDVNLLDITNQFDPEK